MALLDTHRVYSQKNTEITYSGFTDSTSFEKKISKTQIDITRLKN